ncbi:MAG: flavodoxin [Rubrivivax sp.]|nr:flavodoxin [Rubrivivax sp.]
MKVLVVYYSRTGHTRRLAERLAQAFGDRPRAIRERGSRRGPFGYLRSLVEAVGGREAAIDVTHPSPAGYDLVLIGTPIWGWHLSSPVRAFARCHAKQIRRAAFFCTMGGAGDRQAFAELEQLLGRRAEATLALTEQDVADIDGEGPSGRIAAFLAGLKRPGEPAAEHRRAA